MPTEQNFLPRALPDSFALPNTLCISGNCTSQGAPDDSVGFDGYTDIDEVSGTFYVKKNGTWTVQVGSGGGGGAFSSGSTLDPNGVVTGAVGDTYVSAISLGGDGSVWHKVSGSGNTGWE